jgi:uncharacterized protein (TIGR03066 family)
MKKLLTVFLSVCLLSVVTPSCKKDKVDPSRIVGYWKGKLGNQTSYPSAGYAMLFRADGTVRVFNSADTTTGSKAEGTYTFRGATITTNYAFPNNEKFSSTATVDAKFIFQEGTFGSGTNATNGDRFFIKKQ